ncbi:MAG TPA: CidA/LrgA family protein [Clostridiales bacterium]|nr:CidA/LrgA family protein [Clostridiales bacterium]
MKLLKELAILFLLCMVGEVLSYFLPFSIPGSVIGLFLLLALLFSGKLGADPLALTENFFLTNMPLFFIPSICSLITIISVIGDVLAAVLFICIVTTVITFFVTAYVVKLVSKLQNNLPSKTVQEEN